MWPDPNLRLKSSTTEQATSTTAFGELEAQEMAAGSSS
jgi:hypothetical protein